MFELIGSDLGIGNPAPAGWRRLAELPLLVLVGGMGAGKSTTLRVLAGAGYGFRLLPNRRVLTDLLIVAPQQRAQGVPVQSLSREGRLPYIRHYQERFPAGMAQAAAQLWLEPGFAASTATGQPVGLVLDGLRGEQEVRYALEEMPQARFLCLSCPERVRLERLLERRDPYDRFGVDYEDMEEIPVSFSQLGLNEQQQRRAAQVFSAADEKTVFELARSGQVSLLELRQKLGLLLEELSLYDVAAAIRYLQQAAGRRALVVQTDLHLPPQVAAQTLNWLSPDDRVSR